MSDTSSSTIPKAAWLKVIWRQPHQQWQQQQQQQTATIALTQPRAIHVLPACYDTRTSAKRTELTQLTFHLEVSSYKSRFLHDDDTNSDATNTAVEFSSCKQGFSTITQVVINSCHHASKGFPQTRLTFTMNQRLEWPYRR